MVYEAKKENKLKRNEYKKFVSKLLRDTQMVSQLIDDYEGKTTDIMFAMGKEDKRVAIISKLKSLLTTLKD